MNGQGFGIEKANIDEDATFLVKSYNAKDDHVSVENMPERVRVSANPNPNLVHLSLILIHTFNHSSSTLRY